MSIRDHRVYRMVYRFRMAIRESVAQDEVVFRGYAEALTEQVDAVFAPSQELAEAWLKKSHKHTKDFEYIGLAGKPEQLLAVIVEHQW